MHGSATSERCSAIGFEDDTSLDGHLAVVQAEVQHASRCVGSHACLVTLHNSSPTYRRRLHPAKEPFARCAHRPITFPVRLCGPLADGFGLLKGDALVCSPESVAKRLRAQRTGTGGSASSKDSNVALPQHKSVDDELSKYSVHQFRGVISVARDEAPDELDRLRP
eukprot:3585972-Prymnesium_polylepis.1